MMFIDGLLSEALNKLARNRTPPEEFCKCEHWLAIHQYSDDDMTETKGYCTVSMCDCKRFRFPFELD